MFDQITKLYVRLRHCEEGATLVEYGIALGLAVTLGAGALVVLAGDVGGTMSAAGSAMPGSAETGTGG